MNCSEFLERHSDYLDDHLAQDEAARWQEHLRQCDSCARYDRVVRRGTEVLRTQPDLEAPRDLAVRVLHRALDDKDLDGHDRWAGGAFALGIAAVLAIIAWSPVLRTAFVVPSSAEDLVAHTNRAVRPITQDFEDVEQSSPMAMEMSLWTPGYAAPSLVSATIPTRIRTGQTVSPGPYSPLIVEPPRYEPYPPPRRVVWGASTRPRE